MSLKAYLCHFQRLPRALFSPNKTSDSDILGVGLCTTFDDEEDEMTILHGSAVKSCLPFTSSPLVVAAVGTCSLRKQESSLGVSTLMPTPGSPWESPVPCSSGNTCVIENTLSDFFDTPADNLRSRRRQAPGKRAKRNSLGIPSPITGPNTPSESPLHSILWSDKKTRTPASLKRVRFADELGNSSSSKVAKFSENICDGYSEAKLVNSEESKGLVPSTDNDIPCKADDGDVNNVEKQTKDNVEVAGEKDERSLSAVDKGKTTPEVKQDHSYPSRTGCVVNLPVVEASEGSASSGQVELESAEDSATSSVKPDHLTEEQSHHGKTGLAEATGTEKHVTDDDMFSQITAETLADMCEVIMDEPKEQTQSDQSNIRALGTRVEVLEKVKKAHFEAEAKDVHLSTGSPIKDEDTKQQICDQETVCFSSPASKSESCKDEELFTQISPGVMDSILDSAEVLEKASGQSVNRGTPSSSKQQKSQSVLKTSQNVDNHGIGDCKVPAHNSAELPYDACNIQSSWESSTPKTGRVRRGKSKHFLYPSVQQINSSCPKKVFNFKTRNHDGSPVVCAKKSEACNSAISLTVNTPISPIVDATEADLASKMSVGTPFEVAGRKTMKAQLFTVDKSAPLTKGRKQVSSAGNVNVIFNGTSYKKILFVQCFLCL